MFIYRLIPVMGDVAFGQKIFIQSTGSLQLSVEMASFHLPGLLLTSDIHIMPIPKKM